MYTYQATKLYYVDFIPCFTSNVSPIELFLPKVNLRTTPTCMLFAIIWERRCAHTRVLLPSYCYHGSHRFSHLSSDKVLDELLQDKTPALRKGKLIDRHQLWNIQVTKRVTTRKAMTTTDASDPLESVSSFLTTKTVTKTQSRSYAESRGRNAAVLVAIEMNAMNYAVLGRIDVWIINHRIKCRYK